MKLRILSTSDVHGNMYPTNFSTREDYHPFGYLKASAMIEKVRQDNPDDVVIYIENGDFIEGAPLSDYAYQTRDEKHYDQRFMKLTDAMKVDVGILGNHEFNYSPEYLERVYQNKNYPILAANIKEGPQTHIIDGDYTIIERKGLKIAIVGLTTQYIPHWEKPEHIEGWEFESALSAAKRNVMKLRPQVDVIVLAYHGGFEKDLDTGVPTEKLTGENEGYDLLTEIPGVDALVTGHQHREIAQVVNGVPTTQPGYRGANVGMITLDIDNHNEVVGSHAELLSVADTPINAELEQYTRDWQDDVEEWLDQPLATIKGGMRITDHMQARMHGHPYLDLVNHVQMQALGVDISGTSLFNDEVQGFNETVTIRNVMNSYVYPNTLAVEKISGQDLKDALERSATFFEVQADGTIGISDDFSKPKVQLYNYDYYSGIDYTLDVTKPAGSRITSLKYHGKDVQPDQELLVVVNQYRGVGGGDYTMFSADKMVKVDENPVPKLIINYLREKKVIDSVQPTNLTFIQ